MLLFLAEFGDLRVKVAGSGVWDGGFLPDYLRKIFGELEENSGKYGLWSAGNGTARNFPRTWQG